MAAGSKQSAISVKSRAAMASSRRPATDHLVAVDMSVSAAGWDDVVMVPLYGAADRHRIGCAPYFGDVSR